jgi:putative intracellular protease/amidase
VATPGGKAAPVDPGSLPDNESGREHGAYLEAIADVLANPQSLSDAREGEYDAIVLPGGHGPMVDLASDRDLGRLLIDAAARDAVVGVLCHGPAGLLSAIDTDGNYAFAGRRIAVFTDQEERLGGLGENSPYLIESRLRELGAVIESGEPWSSTVVVDGSLISGQNPQSSIATAHRLIEQLALVGAR